MVGEIVGVCVLGRSVGRAGTPFKSPPPPPSPSFISSSHSFAKVSCSPLILFLAFPAAGLRLRSPSLLRSAPLTSPALLSARPAQMVSFYCETCCATLKKPKLDQHAQRCWAQFTCERPPFPSPGASVRVPGACARLGKASQANESTERLTTGRSAGIDCSTTFQGTDYRAHTSCISEKEKYEKTSVAVSQHPPVPSRPVPLVARCEGQDRAKARARPRSTQSPAALR